MNMKITKSKLKQIIKEELGRVLEGYSNSEELADAVIDGLSGDENLSSDDVYRAVDEIISMTESGDADEDEIAQIVMNKLGLQ